MKEVHIECAGAGKTYGIARKVVDMQEKCPEGKKIYVITYTNYAVMQIRSEIIKQIDMIPGEIIIETIHSYLLNCVIYPFAYFVKGETVNTCSIEKLSSNVKYAAIRKKQLKEQGYVYSSDVCQYAKSIIAPLERDKKKDKIRKQIAFDFLLSDLFAIFVDEAQDMDQDFFDIMSMITQRIDNFYFVGDPKQAITKNDVYKNFVESLKSRLAQYS